MLMTDLNETKAQSLVLQARILEEYFTDLLTRENILTRLLIENKNSLTALESLDEVHDAELAVPIGGGVNLPVTLKASQKILINVSKDVAIEKTKAEAINYVNERTKEIEAAISNVLQQKEETSAKLQSIRKQLVQMGIISEQQG
jgi:prefoldin alpha subunit